MKSMKKLVSISLWVFLGATTLAFGQGVGASGDIRGTITDPTGAVLPNVNVSALDTQTGLRRVATTDSTGQFRVTNLPPASYDLSAQVSGFGTEVRKGVVVSVGQTVSSDFQLKVAQTSTEVLVTGEAPAIDTTQGKQANTIEQRYITDLPIDRRDYLTFTLLLPGVSDSTRLADNQDFRVKQTPQSGLSFYGSNGRGNSVTVDGGEANDDSGGVRLTLSQDAVQEFQVNRSNYSAELGGASGASINIVSKTGGNNAHGGVYGFFRNDALDARNPFSFSQALAPGQTFNPLNPDSRGQPVKDSLSRQQFGGTIGFPIKKDKTFVFAAFEGLRQDAQNAVPLLTNTGIFRPQADVQNNQAAILGGLGALGGAPVPCLAAPAPAPAGTFVILPAATCAFALQSILTVNPNPGPNPFVNQFKRASDPFLVNQLESNGGLFPFNTREYLASIRVDQHFNDANQVTARYNFAHDLEESPDVQSLTGFSRGSSIHSYYHTLAAAWFHQFSPFTQNELHAQYNYTNFNVIPNFAAEPGLDIPGFANLGTNIFLPSLTIMRRPEFSDNVTLVRGHHALKFGGQELIRGNHSESHTFFPGRFVFGSLPGGLVSPCLQVPAACGLSATTSPATINPLQSASLGLPQFYEQGFGNPNYNYPRSFSAFYAQDQWQVSPQLTLSYGLRYELDSQYGALASDKDNFAPRFSFALDPFSNHKTVIRGGFGIFYSQVYGQIADVVQTLGNVNGTRQIANILVPLTGDPLNPAVSSASIYQTLFAQGLIQCTTPAAGNAACITPANLAPFGITVANTGPLPPLTVLFSGQPGYQNPYSEQASFGVEHELTPGFSLSLSFIYSHTLRLPVAIDTNALPAPFVTTKLANGHTVTYRDWNSSPLSDPLGVAPCKGAAILGCFANPLILQSDQYSSKASAEYEGGIVEIKKRFSDHFTLLGNYTYSKAFDTATDFNSDFGPVDNTNLAAERSLSDFDQRHKMVVAAVLNSPSENRFLSGFQLSPIVRYNSGHPFNLLAGADVNGDRHSTNDRAIGAPRNTGRGPNYAAFDMRLTRAFRITEKTSLQLIAEGFNITNRTNYGTVNNEVGPGFGFQPGFTTFNVQGTARLSPSQPLGFTSALQKREIQLGVRFSF